MSFMSGGVSLFLSGQDCEGCERTWRCCGARRCRPGGSLSGRSRALWSRRSRSTEPAHTRRRTAGVSRGPRAVRRGGRGRTLGDCPFADASKKPGSPWRTSAAHWALDARRRARAGDSEAIKTRDTRGVCAAQPSLAAGYLYLHERICSIGEANVVKIG